MTEQRLEQIMSGNTAMQLAPVVRNVRVMQTKSLSGRFVNCDYVMMMVVDGKIGVFVNGVRYDLSRGDVMIMPPLIEYMILPIDEHMAMQNIFHFDFFDDPERRNIRGLSVEEVQRQAPVSEQELGFLTKPVVIHLSEQNMMEVRSIFAQMHMHYTRQKPLYLLDLRHLCIQFLLQCCRAGESVTGTAGVLSSKTHANVQKAAAYIRRNYDDWALSNETIAQNLNITPKYLSHIFKDTLGIPIHQYITQVRIGVARKMMALNQYNITEIATSVGYKSIHSFSKMFKLKTGMAPSEYMKKVASDEKQTYNKDAPCESVRQ